MPSMLGISDKCLAWFIFCGDSYKGESYISTVETA